MKKFALAVAALALAVLTSHGGPADHQIVAKRDGNWCC